MGEQTGTGARKSGWQETAEDTSRRPSRAHWSLRIQNRNSHSHFQNSVSGDREEESLLLPFLLPTKDPRPQGPSSPTILTSDKRRCHGWMCLWASKDGAGPFNQMTSEHQRTKPSPGPRQPKGSPWFCHRTQETLGVNHCPFLSFFPLGKEEAELSHVHRLSHPRDPSDLCQGSQSL